MANQFRHKRYFRLKIWHMNDGAFSTDYVFQSVADAKSKIGFSSAFDTSSPARTETLENDDKTLVVTYEFNSEADQTAFKEAIDNEYTNGTVFTGDYIQHTKAQLGISGDQTAERTVKVEHFKTEWLHEDGSISATANF